MIHVELRNQYVIIPELEFRHKLLAQKISSTESLKTLVFSERSIIDNQLLAN